MDKDFILSKSTQSFKQGRTTCPVCGKSFYIETVGRKSYVYKVKNREGNIRYACSHTCYKSLKETIEKSKVYRW